MTGDGYYTLALDLDNSGISARSKFLPAAGRRERRRRGECHGRQRHHACTGPVGCSECRCGRRGASIPRSHLRRGSMGRTLTAGLPMELATALTRSPGPDAQGAARRVVPRDCGLEARDWTPPGCSCSNTPKFRSRACRPAILGSPPIFGASMRPGTGLVRWQTVQRCSAPDKVDLLTVLVHEWGISGHQRNRRAVESATS